MSKWLVVFDRAEFCVMADTLHDAKIEVEKRAPAYGLKRGAHFELYRLEAAANGKY